MVLPTVPSAVFTVFACGGVGVGEGVRGGVGVADGGGCRGAGGVHGRGRGGGWWGRGLVGGVDRYGHGHGAGGSVPVGDHDVECVGGCACLGCIDGGGG